MIKLLQETMLFVLHKHNGSSPMITRVLKRFGMLFCAMFVSAIAVRAEPVEDADLRKVKDILPKFEAIADEEMRKNDVPGMAIAIVYNDQAVYLKGFGVKTVDGTEKVDPRTVFQIGSISKSFTSALMAMLVDEGKFGWKDTVVDLFPDFMMFDPWVTRQFLVEDLMAQRSGLPATAGDLQIFFDVDRRHIIHSLRYIKPASSFRSEFAYQNGLFLVAGRLIEVLTGKSWEDNLSERILMPLGMSDTSATFDAFNNAKDVTSLHQRIDGKVTALPRDWPYIDYVYLLAPAGGINSNAIDMANYLRLHMNEGEFSGKRLVSKENMGFVHSPKTVMHASVSGPNLYYCEGWVYQEYHPYSILWHNGETSGAKNMLAYAPEAGIGIVVLSNLRDTKLPEKLAFHFFDMYFGTPLEDSNGDSTNQPKKVETIEKCQAPPANTEPAMPLSEYAGTYINDVYGKIKVTKKDRNLVLTMGSKKVEMPMLHWNRDVFCLTVPVVDAPADGFASFHISPGSKVVGVTLEAFNPGDIGFFERAEQDSSP